MRRLNPIIILGKLFYFVTVLHYLVTKRDSEDERGEKENGEDNKWTRRNGQVFSSRTWYLVSRRKPSKLHRTP